MSVNLTYLSADVVADEARRIVEHLSGWSLQHGIAWDLRCAGEAVGHIVEGKPDEKLLAFLKDLAKTAALGRPDVELGSEAGDHLARELDKKYASRWS